MRELSKARKVALVFALSAALVCSGCALLVAGAAAGGAAGGVAAAHDNEGQSHGPMTYVASVLASVVYFPAKVVFASAGAVTSGVAYLVTVGNSQSTNSIWTASVEGDYVVRPDVIDGTRPLHFVGS
jgi:hypothetical protein